MIQDMTDRNGFYLGAEAILCGAQFQRVSSRKVGHHQWEVAIETGASKEGPWISRRRLELVEDYNAEFIAAEIVEVIAQKLPRVEAIIRSITGEVKS